MTFLNFVQTVLYLILILKTYEDSMRKEHYISFLFVNAHESENVKLNLAMYTKIKKIFATYEVALTLQNL